MPSLGPEDEYEATGVQVAWVDDDGDRITADIYGGPEGVVGTIVYTPEGDDYSRIVATLREWAENGTRLTFAWRRGMASLWDESAHVNTRRA